MSEDMLSKVLVRELPGLMRDFMKKVLGENGQEWVNGFKLFLKKQNPWPEPASRPVRRRSALLDPLKTVVEFSGVNCFKVHEHLKTTSQNERGNTELIIDFLSDTVRDNFLGKIEENVPSSRLRAYRLKKGSVDGPIIAELGGEKAVETTVAEMVELMRRHGRGQSSILLTNGYSNIFYIRDAKGILWAVDCYWDSGYGSWFVGANLVADPGEWHAGSQVFARDSDSRDLWSLT